MESAKIYLCKADCSILGSITGLKIETCSFTKNATDLWELSFEVNRYIDNNGSLIQSNYYDSIDEMMKIYFDSDDEQLFFMIDSEPVICGEGIQETKTVTAHSIECELCNIYLNNFKINCGTSDSQEYLACETDENGIINYYNVNPYTGPNEYILLVNYNNPQLSLLHLALQGTGWSVKPDIDPGICSIKLSCDIQSNNVYAFLMNVVSPSASIIFEFDRKRRQIGAVTMENYGEDTGIFVSMRNLVNSFEISSFSDDTIKTKIIPSGADNLGIEYVNFGSDYIINLDYFMNTVNEYGDYKYVSKELHDKYNLWKNYRETEKETFQDKQYTRRELYIELTKLYNQTILDINELKNRVPNDGVVTDYKTFSLEELKLHLNAFSQALVALETLYKNEYGVKNIGDAPDYIPVAEDPSKDVVTIKDTPYWHDFYAYKESIIPQIKEALKMYCQTGSNGNLVTDNGYFIELEYGNPAYYADPSIVKEIDAYQYEWSLYGLEELEAKKKAWLEVSNLLFNECFIQSGTSVSPDAYRTPDDAGWNSLSDTQRKEFTSKSAYIDKLNQYLDYMSFDERDNSLTKTKCKGIIRQCDEAIILCKNKIASIENLQNEYQTQRKKLANSVDIEKFKVNDTLLFTEKDLNIINSMIREQDYNNSNIITTNLDDIVTSIDAQKELYQAAVEELYKLSRPQYSFSATIDNLYALEEFQCFHDDFKVGNFIRVGLELHEELCDANFIKLRVISITYNPILPDENLSVEFSTMTKSLSGLNDLDFLLSKSSSGGSSSGASSSSSGGTYGNNNANVQMSNNMLNALLSTELFGTAVTDVILDSIQANRGNFNTLLSHSGVFDSLEAGQIKVSGECLFDIIRSSNWNGNNKNILSNTEGSIIDLSDGCFNFAGGKLKWDNKILSIDGSGTFTGDIVANSLKLGQDVKINNTSITGLSKVATSGDFNDLSNTSDILMTDDVSIEATTDISGITTKTITIGEHIYTTKESDNYILTNVGLGTNNDEHNNSYFKVSKEGLLEANNAVIYGTVYATNGRFSGEVNATSGTFTGDVTANILTANQSGTIAGWKIDSDGFHRENEDETFSQSIDSNGLSISDFFFVQPNGLITTNPEYYKIMEAYQWTGNEPLTSLIILYGSKYAAINDDANYLYIYTFSENVKKICISGYFSENVDDDDSHLEKKDINITISESMICSKIYNYKKIKLELDDIVFGYHFDDAIHYPSASASIDSIGLYDDLNNRVSIFKIDIYSYKGVFKDSIFLNKIRTNNDFVINSLFGQISLKTLDIHPLGINAFNDFEFNIFPENSSNDNPNVTISSTTLKHSGVYDITVSSGSQLRINSDGIIQRYASSSKRYKNSITTNISEELNPHKLYDLNIVQFKYNQNYLSEYDQRYNKNIIGFLVEDIYEKYPIACNLENNEPEVPEYNMLIAPILKLIQEQHEEIETMKEQFQQLKNGQ